jgi:hypothetical protein
VVRYVRAGQARCVQPLRYRDPQWAGSTGQNHELAAFGFEGQLDRGAFADLLGIKRHNCDNAQRCGRPGYGVYADDPHATPTNVSLPPASGDRVVGKDYPHVRGIVRSGIVRGIRCFAHPVGAQAGSYTSANGGGAFVVVCAP